MWASTQSPAVEYKDKKRQGEWERGDDTALHQFPRPSDDLQSRCSLSALSPQWTSLLLPCSVSSWTCLAMLCTDSSFHSLFLFLFCFVFNVASFDSPNSCSERLNNSYQSSPGHPFYVPSLVCFSEIRCAEQQMVSMSCLNQRYRELHNISFFLAIAFLTVPNI